MKEETVLNESELYRALGRLTKDKDSWEDNIPYLYSLLDHSSDKIKAKALWLLGEAGLAHPSSLDKGTAKIACFLDSADPLLRARALNALGRIGRGDYKLIEGYFPGLFRFADDDEAQVRLSFIWASENIATNTPDIYEGRMQVFERLLHDTDEKVRMEAPEIFRVLGRRRPRIVLPYKDILQGIAESDGNRVVRIHCSGAVRAMSMNHS